MATAPTALDIKARALAQRLVSKYGKSIVYSDTADGTYDPNTSTSTPGSTSYPIKGIVEDYSFRTAGAGFTAGLLREGDKQITLAALDVVFLPQAGDKITVDGAIYTAMNVKNTYSGELVAAYVVHARQ